MTALLEVEAISRSFGGVRAVRDVSFEIGSGEIAALIGPNGAGKSTTFSLVSGTLQPNSGRVTFKGRKIVGRTPSSIVRLGLVRTFQSTAIFARASVLENVLRGAFVRDHAAFWASLFGTPQSPSRISESARITDILDLLSLGPHRNQLAGTLPYGLQRRLGIAIALATRPELLLLDEPAAGLNDEETARIGAVIGQISSHYGAAVLLVEHHMKLVMSLCSRILVLNHGELIASGTPAEIAANPQVIEAYLGAPDAPDDA